MTNYIDNNLKNANIDLRKIANFHKFAKMYTRQNIYVHSIQMGDHYLFKARISMAYGRRLKDIVTVDVAIVFILHAE